MSKTSTLGALAPKTVQKLAAVFAEAEKEENQKPDQKGGFSTDNKVSTPTDGFTIATPPSLGGIKKLMASGRVGGKNGKRLTNLRTKTTIVATGSSASATAYFPVFTFDPSAIPDIASWKALYDEVKIHGATVHWRVITSSMPGIPVTCGFSYDPIDNTAVSSLVALLDAQQHCGPCIAGTIASSTCNSMPNVVSKMGYWTKKIVVPKEPQNNAASAIYAAGMWSDLQSPGYYGFLKFAIGAGTGVMSVEIFVQYDIEFRSRA